MDPPPQRVEILIPVKTLLVLAAFGALVVLAVVSFGTLLSIFVAAVIALGLDPVVARMVARRGWGGTKAALALFDPLFAGVFAFVVVTAGPVWDEIVEFVNSLPQYWEEIS